MIENNTNTTELTNSKTEGPIDVSISDERPALLDAAPLIDNQNPRLMEILSKKYTQFVDSKKELKASNNGVVTVDLDQMDPMLAAKELQSKLDILSERAELSKYLKDTSFQDIEESKIPLKIEDKNERRARLNKIIKELSRNGELSADGEFIKKLYKLKETETLIEESIEKEAIEKELTDISIQTWELIITYKKKLNLYLSSLELKKENGDELSQREKIQELGIKYAELETEHNNIKEKYLRIVDILTTMSKDLGLDINKEESFLEEVLLLCENIKISLEQKDINEQAHQQEKDAISTLNVEKFEEMEQENKALEERLESLYRENEEREKKLINQISDLENSSRAKEELIENLKKELDDLTHNNQNQQPKSTTVVENSYENDTTEEEPKQKTSTLKVVLGIFGFLLVLIMGAGVYGYMSLEEAPPMKKPIAYAQPKQVMPQPQRQIEQPTPSVATRENILPKPMPQVVPQMTTNEAQQIQDSQLAQTQTVPVPTEPAVAPQEVAFDYVRNLSIDEFNSQDFKILDKNTISYNNKKVEANEIVNGYRLIKSTSTGNILFVSPSNEPFWIKGAK